MAIAMYNGNEPYIFISYAHKNSDVVVPIIEALANNGFRVWYDAGIEAGTEWPEYVAEKLLGSTVVIAFISKAALESQNCRREINFAISENKSVLSVYIEDVSLTPGMKMQLSTTQAMFYNRLPYEAFLQKLTEAAVLAPCRRAGAAATPTQASKTTSTPLSQSVTKQKVPVTAPTAPAQKPLDSPLNDFEIENGVLKKYVGKSAVVVIPDGVTSIGERAFKDYKSLTRIVIPNSVTCIGDYSFYGCGSLKNITIPEGVTSIGENAFSFCGDLRSITIPGSVASICKSAFYYCSSLNNVVLSHGVTSIGEYAFFVCGSLRSITIPDSVTSIGEQALSHCESLVSITVDENNPVYHSSGDCLIETATGTLVAGCMNSVIPDGVTHIGEYSFYCCEKLASITIPDSVTSIGKEAFRSCDRLTSIMIPAGVTSIDDWAFYNCKGLESIVVDGDNPVYYSAGNCLIEAATGVLIVGCMNSVIPSNVTSINNRAFSYCKRLARITIPDGVTDIGDWMFECCESLTSITIPYSVTDIGKYAFYHCEQLTEITVPDSVTSMDACVFQGCKNLTIYCRAESQPVGWADNWNPDNRPVVWGWKG